MLAPKVCFQRIAVIGTMGPKRRIKIDSSQTIPGKSNADVEGNIEEDDTEVADYSNMTVTQLREVVRERGMSSPKAKTR